MAAEGLKRVGVHPVSNDLQLSATAACGSHITPLLLLVTLKLVVASTCDHFTRVTTGGSKLPASAPVYGLLFGTRNDEVCSICDSVDINYTYEGQQMHILPGEIESKVKLWTAVFTTYKLVGWYGFGAGISADHNKFHGVIAQYTEDPAFLLINQSALTNVEELPLNVYIAGEGSNEGSSGLRPVHFIIETSEVEKVALDHITKSTPVPGLSSLEVKNQSTLTSLQILDNKVGTIVETLRAMQEGRIPVDHALLRSASRICHSLPPVDSAGLKNTFSTEVTNSLLITYLSAATRTTTQLEEAADVYNSTYGDRGMSHT
jgi:hypothetical protein